jgi:predicted nucleic acid-binding Zn ribbon protein
MLEEGTMNCAWQAQSLIPCMPIQYILAYQCDKCGEKKTILLCPKHHEDWLTRSPGMYCPKCGGTLSYKIRDMETGGTATRINT